MNANQSVTITADHENNAEIFWNNFQDAFQDLAHLLGAGNTVTISREKWVKIQAIPGFSDGPEFARGALIEVSK